VKSSGSGSNFPLKHFTGNDAKKLIAIDNKFHGKDQIKTKALIDYEIKDVINPCLAASSVDAEVKAHLEAKKKSLEVFKQVSISHWGEFQMSDISRTLMDYLKAES